VEFDHIGVPAAAKRGGMRFLESKRLWLTSPGDHPYRVEWLWYEPDSPEAEAFVQRHTDWVARQRARLTPSAFGPDERAALRKRARAELPLRLMEIAAEHGLTVTGVSIRNQRTRWGSCGRDGNISLNWRLVLMPPAVRDYVLIHELMHLKRLDHSPAYWKLVAAACPDYRESRQWLRINGPALR